MIKPLTSLRFLFALMVFTSHLGFLDHSDSSALKWIWEYIFKEGYIGVSFFFILSGFILALNYQDSLAKKETSKKTFYIARIARIYPLHLLTFLLAIPLTVNVFNTNKAIWFLKAGINATLLQSFFPLKNIYFSFNSPSWSISNEMFFYLIFPFLILFSVYISKIRFKWLAVFITVGIIPFIAIFLPSNYAHPLLYINPIFRIFDFILGILLYKLYRWVIENKTKCNYNLMELTAVFLLVMFFAFHSFVPIPARYSFYYWIPMSYLIFSFSFQNGLISALISKRIFIHLGQISFGFYMYHQLVIRYFHEINNAFFYLENQYLIMLVTFFISIIISHYSYVFFETPANRFIRRIAKR